MILLLQEQITCSDGGALGAEWMKAP